MTESRRHFVWSVAASIVTLSLAGTPIGALAQSDDGEEDSDSAGTYGPAVWIRIPSIRVDAHISDVGVVDGYYDVPWFDVGHHVDSHSPGEAGNCVLNGHVVTVNAGEVFRRLDELQPSHAIYVYTPTHRLDWAVQDVFAVAEDNGTFLLDTVQPRLTLYTCTGHFNPIERNYNERLVVVADLVSVAMR